MDNPSNDPTLWDLTKFIGFPKTPELIIDSFEGIRGKNRKQFLSNNDPFSNTFIIEWILWHS